MNIILNGQVKRGLRGNSRLIPKDERIQRRCLESVKMCPLNLDLNKITVDKCENNLQKKTMQNSKSISRCENDYDGRGNDEWCSCDRYTVINEHLDGE